MYARGTIGYNGDVNWRAKQRSSEGNVFQGLVNIASEQEISLHFSLAADNEFDTFDNNTANLRKSSEAPPTVAHCNLVPFSTVMKSPSRTLLKPPPSQASSAYPTFRSSWIAIIDLHRECEGVHCIHFSIDTKMTLL